MSRASCLLVACALAACTPAGSPADAPTPPESVLGASADAAGAARSQPAAPPRPRAYGRPRAIGRFPVPLAPEASGLAASRRNPGVLYVLDDGPGVHEVLALDTQGQRRWRLNVEGLNGRDTEALAVGPCAAQERRSCVYIGDIGDNQGEREAIVVYRFVEPKLDQRGSRSVRPDVAVLRYPTTATDAEALIVGPDARLVIIAKAAFDSGTGRTAATRVYTSQSFGDGTLRGIGRLDVPDPVTPLRSLLTGNVVTDADFQDGRLLVLTYDHVVEFTPRSAAGLGALDQWRPRAVPWPPLPQGEAITYAQRGCGYYGVSEGDGDVWFVPCVAREASIP